MNTRSKSAKVSVPKTGDGATVVAVAGEKVSTPSVQASADSPPHAGQSAPSRTSSAATSRSTIVARQLEAQALHARRLADIENERERERHAAERHAAEIERQAADRAVERERHVAELELKASLAAIEASASQRGGSRGTRSRASVQDWVNNVTPNPTNNIYSVPTHLSDTTTLRPSARHRDRERRTAWVPWHAIALPSSTALKTEE